jgi:hypothetical protein
MWFYRKKQPDTRKQSEDTRFEIQRSTPETAASSPEDIVINAEIRRKVLDWRDKHLDIIETTLPKEISKLSYCGFIDAYELSDPSNRSTSKIEGRNIDSSELHRHFIDRYKRRLISMPRGIARKAISELHQIVDKKLKLNEKTFIWAKNPINHTKLHNEYTETINLKCLYFRFSHFFYLDPLSSRGNFFCRAAKIGKNNKIIQTLFKDSPFITILENMLLGFDGRKDSVNEQLQKGILEISNKILKELPL